MGNKTIPEAFHPGEYIRMALEAKGWAQLDLAAIIGKPASVISDILVGRRPITPEIALALGEVFENGAQVWLNLQAAYQLAVSEASNRLISRRTKLFNKAPIREIQKRHWIEESSNIEVLEAQFCQFFGIKRVDDEIIIAHAARKSDDYERVSVPKLAWITRAQNLAKRLVGISGYTKSSFSALLNELSSLKQEPESVAMVPETLSRYGIRFLVIEHLPQTKIDGACFWLNKSSPVIVVSIRYDRIDYFWHTLMHELMHVKEGHGKNVLLVEISIVGDDVQADNDKVEKERIVDKLARDFLVEQTQLHDFVLRHGPFFSKAAILRFAKLIEVHPGIIVGQLQHDRVIPYKYFRPLLVKIRDIIASTALTDGWGQVITD